MAVTTADGNVVSLNKVHAYADRIVKKELIAGIHKRVPLITYLTGRMRSDSNLGRPGTLGLIGGAGNFDAVQRQTESGIETHLRLLANRTGGFKVLAERDTTPSTGNTSQDQNVKTAIARWTHVMSQPIKVWNSTLRASRGAEIGRPIREATDQAMEELIDNLVIEMYRKAPTDQSANFWDHLLGVVHAMNVNNTYLNLNRSSTTFTNPITNAVENYWNGKRVTASKTPTIDLIDDAMFEQGLAEKMNMAPDLVLCGASNYHTLKKEALAKGAASMISEEIPEFSKMGVQFEAIRYGRTTIVYDPNLTGDWSSDDADITDATKLVLMFHTEDWVFGTHSSENFRTTPFVDQGESKPGGDDAITAEVRVMPKLYCKRPWNQIAYTQVG